MQNVMEGIELDISKTPFARHKSYLGLKDIRGKRAPAGQDGVYIVSYVNGSSATLRVEPVRDGQPVAGVSIRATPSLVELEAADGGRIQICYDGLDILRFRGAGLGLRLVPVAMAVPYWLPDQALRLNVMALGRQYGLQAITGTLAGGEAVQGYMTDTHTVVDVVSDAAGNWEIAVEEFDASWMPHDAFRAFDVCRDEVAAEFAGWGRSVVEQLPGALAGDAWVAAYLLWSCTLGVRGFMTRPGILMSRNWMCGVWSWDNCFNALALVETHPELAWDQLRLFMDHQDSCGSFPDSVAALRLQTNFVKPPVWGLFVDAMLERAPDSISADELRTVHAALKAQVQWWLDYRRVSGQPLPHYYNGNDSGWDNGSMFAQGVPVTAPDLAAFLAMQADTIARLSRRFGQEQEAVHWTAQADALVDALVSELWDGSRFVAKHARTHDLIATQSLLYCLPIVLGARLPEAVRERLVANIREFETDWGVASEHPDSPLYGPDGYWLGPVWPAATLLIVHGLRACGEDSFADDLTSKFNRMCRGGIFAENYNALTGAANCDPGYTWSAAAFLALNACNVNCSRDR